MTLETWHRTFVDPAAMAVAREYRVISAGIMQRRLGLPVRAGGVLILERLQALGIVGAPVNGAYPVL